MLPDSGGSIDLENHWETNLVYTQNSRGVPRPFAGTCFIKFSPRS